jgi:lysophospholipase L1-like esterase
MRPGALGEGEIEEEKNMKSVLRVASIGMTVAAWCAAAAAASAGTTAPAAPVVSVREGNQVDVATGGATATFTVSPPRPVVVVDERYVLSNDVPDRWAKGTHLKGCYSPSTVLPDCLVPGSVVVKRIDGTVLERDKDYRLDERWASLGRIDGGRIPDKAEVLVSYHVGRMRLDGIDVTRDGKVVRVEGEPAKYGAVLPPVTADGRRVASVFMANTSKVVEPWQVFTVEGPFPEPTREEVDRRAGLVLRTLDKLRRGEPVTIVAWGDSVTAGGDVSKDEAFPQAFAAQLRKRFPKATVTLVNAGIGATHTDMRLPNLPKDVLAHRPDLVTVEFVNDMPYSAEHYRKNYERIVREIRDEGGAEVLFVTPHFTMPLMMGLEHPRGGETRANVQRMREIGAEKRIGVADASRRWEHLEREGIPYTTCLANGINHPDARGHQMFVAELMSFFPE